MIGVKLPIYTGPVWEPQEEASAHQPVVCRLDDGNDINCSLRALDKIIKDFN